MSNPTRIGLKMWATRPDIGSGPKCQPETRPDGQSRQVVRAVIKLTQINLSYRGLHSDVPPVCCEVSRALIRRGLATLARLRTEATPWCSHGNDYQLRPHGSNPQYDSRPNSTIVSSPLYHAGNIPVHRPVSCP